MSSGPQNDDWRHMLASSLATRSAMVFPATFAKALDALPSPDPRSWPEIAARTLESFPQPLDEPALRFFLLERATLEQAQIVRAAIALTVAGIQSFHAESPADEAILFRRLLEDSDVASLAERGLQVRIGQRGHGDR